MGHSFKKTKKQNCDQKSDLGKLRPVGSFRPSGLPCVKAITDDHLSTVLCIANLEIYPYFDVFVQAQGRLDFYHWKV